MKKIIAVTNRKLCHENFYSRIERLADSGINAIILREKDIHPYEYMSIAEKVIDICRGYDTDIVLHTFIQAADELNHKKIHLPIKNLKTLEDFKIIGVSCHSKEDLERAEKFNASYITFGHVFKTNCKKDLSPRGLEALENVCDNAKVPVYALGGISPDNSKSAIKAGAAGVSIMSSAMEADDPNMLIQKFKRVLDK